jgi:hypothetical protein
MEAVRTDASFGCHGGTAVTVAHASKRLTGQDGPTKETKQPSSSSEPSPFRTEEARRASAPSIIGGLVVPFAYLCLVSVVVSLAARPHSPTERHATREKRSPSEVLRGV